MKDKMKMTSKKVENIPSQKMSDRDKIPQRKQIAMGSKTQAHNLGKCSYKKSDI